MKKKNKKNLLKKVFDFFDRIIITPITKLIIKIGDLSKNNKVGIEKFLTNKQSLLIISLIAAFAIFYTVDQKTTSLIDNSAEVLYGQPVRAIYNEELYTVEGIPKTADVTLIGRKWDVYLAKQYPADEIVLDLQDLKPGTHRVNMKYYQKVKSVEYKLDPSSVTVVVYEKISANRELTYDIIHKDKLDTKLNIEGVTLSRDNVIIKGAEYKLEKVASVKALIDVDNLTEAKVGSITLKDVPLIAYDQEGNSIDVEIVPNKVDATVKISSPKKDVPVKVITKGELNNKSIKSLTPSISTVTIYGDAKALEDIEYVEAEVDISGVKENKKYTVALKMPPGVRKLSESKITVNLVVDDIVTKEITGVRISSANLGSGLKVQASSKEDSSISVILKGSKSVIDTIDSSKITAYIDLSGLGVGEHEAEIKVSGNDDRISYTSKVKKIKVIIIKE